MDSLETLIQTMAREARDGVIGRPVCFRASFVLSADHGKLSAILAGAAGAAFRCLADEPLDLCASGSAAAGHLTLLAQGKTGTTVLLSTSLLRDGQPRADILVLGSRGTLHHEGDANAPHLDLAGPSWSEAQLPEGDLRFYAAIEASLKDGSAVRVAEGDDG